MRRLLTICAILASTAAAEDAAGPSREKAVDRILSERGSEAEFHAALATARLAGVGGQALLEARFLYHIDQGDDAKIAALAPEFSDRKETFKLEESEIFASIEDWLAVVEFTQAVAALERDDSAAFKTHITEAFWLSPAKASAFAPYIERFHLAAAMKEVRVDFSTRLATIHGRDASTMARIIGASPATLLHFWSPWSRECEEMMNDFATTARELARHDIAVISILPEQSDDVRADALELIEPLGENPPGAWLVDRPNSPLASQLRIRNLPTFVLIAADGRVLFNGHPADPECWNRIIDIAPNATRPPSP